MQCMRHGCPTCHRAMSLSSSRLVSNMSQSRGSIAAHPMHVNCHVRKPAVSSSLARMKGVDSQPAFSWMQGRGVTSLSTDSMSAAKHSKILRRKRWRADESYPPPAFPDRERFSRRYLEGPRLPPLTATTTEVIVPDYMQNTDVQRHLGVGSKVTPTEGAAKGKELAVESQSRPRNRPRAPQSTKKSFSIPPGPIATTQPVNAPLPISNGHGDVEERADRCRQAIQRRDVNKRSVLDGLTTGGEGSAEEARGNTFRPVPQPPEVLEQSYAASTQLTIQPQVCRNPSIGMPVQQSRKYSSLSSGVYEPSDLQLTSHRVDPVLKSTFRAVSGSRTTPDKTARGKSQGTLPESQRADPNTIGGFTRDWKGEEWQLEEWKDAWGVNNQSCSTDELQSALKSLKCPTIHLGRWMKMRAKSRTPRFFNKKSNITPPIGPILTVPKDRGGKRSLRLKLDDPLKCQDESSLAYRLSRYIHGHPEASATAVTPEASNIEDDFLSLPFSFDHAGNVDPETKTSRLNANEPDSLSPNTVETVHATPCHPHILAATRIIARAAKIAPNTESTDSASPGPEAQAKPHPEHTKRGLAPASQVMEVQVDSKPIATFSRKALKAAALALKTKAKRDILSPRRTAKPQSQDRKAVVALRKQKKLAALKNVISGSLKPLVADETVLVDVHPPGEQHPVARLAHGLDRALFSQSVQWLQDPHSRVFNFPPSLQTLPSVTDFAFEKLPKYVRGSNDEDLNALAAQHCKRFSGTTSSLTSFLSHIYFLISGDRRVNISTLSMAFSKQPRNFTPGLRAPATFTLHHRRYASEEHAETMLASNPAVEQSLHCALQCSTSGVTVEGSESDVMNSLISEDTTSPLPREFDQANCEVTILEPTVELLAKTEAPPEGVSDVLSICADEVDSPEAGVKTDSSSPPNGDCRHDLNPEGSSSSNSSPNTSRYIDTYAFDTNNDDLMGKRNADLNFLAWLGKMTENFLTLSEQDFNSLLRKNISTEHPSKAKTKETYRYSKSSKFVMRSQLDCQDSRLPGTGVFDIKTRAVLPIRIDQLNYQANSGYLIRKMTGLLGSFEREYYDLIRGAFLKYNFQARIGAMDGIFVAYHNTARIFGFQYIPVTEMEERLYGPGSPERGDKVFEKCVELMEVLSDQIVACFPGQSVSCTVDAREGAEGMIVWVTPVNSPSEPPPIVEFKVTVSHTIDGHPASSETAIDQAQDDWVLEYKITRSSRPASKIWKALEATKVRQFKHILPEGVSEEQMLARLANVNWGAGQGFDAQPEPEAPAEPSSAGERASVDPSAADTPSPNFTAPSRNVRRLRKLALAGRAEMQREEELAARQVVWGRDHDALAAAAGAAGGVVPEALRAEPDPPEAAPVLSSPQDPPDAAVVPVTSVAAGDAAHYELADAHPAARSDASAAQGAMAAVDLSDVETSLGRGWEGAARLVVGVTVDRDDVFVDGDITPTWEGAPPPHIIENTPIRNNMHDAFPTYHL